MEKENEQRIGAFGVFLLRGLVASQQTNFGRVRDLPGLSTPEASFTSHIWMQYITEFNSISRLFRFGREWYIDVEENLPFRAESQS